MTIHMTQEELNKKLLDAAENNIEEVREALSLGADVDSADIHGYTALMYACWNGDINITRLLIEHSADVNAVDNIGETALMRACWNGHIDTIQLLIEHGADISLKDKDGKTALDILKNNFPQQYKKWTEKTIIKSKQKKLRKEDSQAKQSTVPDYNI